MNNEPRPVKSVALDICFSNRCNQQCTYCYHESLNKTAPAFLSFEQIAKAVRHHINLVGTEGVDKICLAGGEPLLDYKLLIKVVRFLRKEYGPDMRLQLYTNGTLLSPERARELLSHGTSIVISIDGDRASHDRNRVFKNGSSASTFDKIMKTLGRLSKPELNKMEACMTVAPNTASELARNVGYLRAFGFGQVSFALDSLRIWTPEEMRRLKKGALALRHYYKHLVAANKGRLHTLNFGLKRLWLKWPETPPEAALFNEISLAPDGYFYPHSTVSTYAGQKTPFRIGSYAKGFDPARLSALNKSVTDFFLRQKNLPRNCDSVAHSLLYFTLILEDLNPRDYIKNVIDTFAILRDTLGPFHRLEQFMHSIHGDKELQELDCRIVGTGLRQAAEITLPRRARAAGKKKAGQNRERIRFEDFLCCGPENKNIILQTGDTPPDFAATARLALYLLLRADSLNKDISIFIKPPLKRPLPKDTLQFFRDHRLHLLPYGRQQPRAATGQSASGLFGGL